MSNDKDYVIFVESKFVDEYYIEDENGYPKRIDNFSEAVEIAGNEAESHPGSEIKIYQHIATFQTPISKPQIRMIK